MKLFIFCLQMSVDRKAEYSVGKVGLGSDFLKHIIPALSPQNASFLVIQV